MVAYILLALGVVSLVAFLVFRDKNGSVFATVLKTLTSLLFIATAVTAFCEGEPVSYDRIVAPAMMVIIGLTLGMIGDFTLDMKIVFKSLKGVYSAAEKDSDTFTFAGMAAFGIGHILYISAIGVLYPASALNILWSFLAAVVFGVAVIVVASKVMGMQFGKFLIPSIIYVCLLSWFLALTVATGITEGMSTDLILLICGSALFLLSDLVLSMTYFSKPEDYKKTGALAPDSRLMISVNHVLYYAAQFCIALALMFI